MSYVPPKNDVYTEVYSDPARAERILTLVQAVAQGWLLIGWSAFEHPPIARLYSFPGMSEQVFEGALQAPPETHAFPDRLTALTTLREEYNLAKTLLVLEDEQLNKSGARVAAFNAMRTNLVSRLQEAIVERLRDNPDETANLGLFFDKHRDLIAAITGHVPVTPQEVHNHQHVHLGAGGPEPPAIDWQAGLRDLGAITQPQLGSVVDVEPESESVEQATESERDA